MNFICGEYFAENCEFVFDEGYLNFSGGVYTPKGQKQGTIQHNKFIFYKNEYAFHKNYIFANPHFLKEVLDFVKNTNKKYILITHKLDSTIDLNFKNRQGITFFDIISNENIEHWYAQNAFINHKKISYIPIGIECPRIEMHDIISKSNFKNINREISYLANFNMNLPFCIFNEREILGNILKSKNISNKFNLFNRNEFIKDLTNSYFCLSPTGGGIDCHRTWLALYCGSIPVLTRNNITEKIEKKLPVLLIDKWEDLDFNILNKDTFLKLKQNKMEINNLNLDNFIHILNIFNENTNSINSLQ